MKGVWFTTIQDILGGNVDFCNTKIVPSEQLIPAAKYLAADADTKRVLMVISSDGEHAEVNGITNAINFFPNLNALKWGDSSYNGSHILIWKCEASSSVAYFSELKQTKPLYPSDRQDDNQLQLSALAFSPVSCPYTFDKERAQTVFLMAREIKPDVVLFGLSVVTNKESIRIILEQRLQVAPTCRVAFVGRHPQAACIP